MTRQQVIDKQIEEIMDEFDFHFVHKMFVQNGWKYFNSDDTPSVSDLRRTARRLLQMVSEKPCDGVNYTNYGMFFVYFIEDTGEKWLRMTLMFAPTEWGIDTGDEYE